MRSPSFSHCTNSIIAIKFFNIWFCSEKGVTMKISRNRLFLVFLSFLVITSSASDLLIRIPLFSFILEAFKKPGQIGAIAPSSSYVANEILRYTKINSDPRNILEIGAGIGNITKFILKELRSDDILDVIEFDPKYCEILRKKFGHYKNVNIIEASILDWSPDYKYDFIISTLPHTALAPELVKKIINHYKKLIKKDGFLSYIEYIGFSKITFLKMWGKARWLYKKKLKKMKKFKEANKHKTSIVLCNLPPTYVHHLKF